MREPEEFHRFMARAEQVLTALVRLMQVPTTSSVEEVVADISDEATRIFENSGFQEAYDFVKLSILDLAEVILKSLK